MPSRCEGADLARFHVGGFVILVMVVAEEVKRAVDEKMGRMIFNADAFVRRLGLADAAREYDVTEQQFWSGNICSR